LSPLSLGWQVPLPGGRVVPEEGACSWTQESCGRHPGLHTEAAQGPASSRARDRRLEGDQESETSGMQDVRNPSGPGSLLRGQEALLASAGLTAARLYAAYPEIPGKAVLQAGNARLDQEFWEF